MNSERFDRAFALSVSVLVVLAGVAGVALLPMAGAQDTGNTGGADPTARFNQSVVTEQRGDIAAIGVNLSGTESATVTVGSEAVNYRTNVTVSDGNDDGRVTLLMNTFTAGMDESESAVYTAAADDDVTETNRTTGQLRAPLEVSSYNLSVVVDGRQTDTATLRLTPRASGELVTWTAPATSFDNVTNASGVARAVEGGRITTTDTVAVGDVLVLQFKLSGIYGALSASNFSQLVEEGALDLTIEQTNPGTNRRPKQLDLNRSLANDSIQVIPDERNDVLYVNVDTGSAVFENGAPTAGDEFESTLTLAEESDLAAQGQSIAANVTLVGAELSFGEVALATDANQTVTGTTSVAPGSEVTVRLESLGPSSFVKTNTTTVKSNGTFVGTFNLSETTPRTRVDVQADGPFNASDRTTVAVRRSRSNESTNGTASLAIADQRSTGETVTVDNVTLPAGGFVVVHAPNVSSAPIESTLGASSYLTNGTNENVEITLDRPLPKDSRVVVMAHTDSNENRVYDFSSSNGSEDVPYTADGDPVTASARIEVEKPTRSATTTAGATTDGTARATTGTDGPGFGVVLAGVVVVLATLAAVVALGRE